MLHRAAPLLLGAQLAAAQIFKFEGTPVPPVYTLSTHYLFHVYSEDEAPQKVAGTGPSVEFRQLMVKKTAEAKAPPAYRSIEVGLLPYDQLWSIVDKERFCTTQDGNLKLNTPASGKSLSDLGVRVQTVPLLSAEEGVTKKTETFPITKTGRYILTFVNCGNFSQATITGSVAVKNSYGYLPGHEFFSMRLFGVLSIFYVLLALVWLRVTVKNWSGLFYVHKGIGTILAFAVLECLVAWVQYKDWNDTGDRRDVFFIGAILFYTMKYVLSWRLLLLASLGAGTVYTDLSTKTSVIFFIVSSAFLVQACLWKLIMSYRYSHALEAKFLLWVTLPGVCVYVGIFMWTFFALTSLISRCSERNLKELVSLFSKVRLILAVGLAMAFFVLMLQIMDIAMGGAMFSWEYRWISTDGAPQLGFMLVLMGMMVVWWPRSDGFNYGYAVQQDEEEKNELAAPPAADEDEYVNVKKNKVAPDSIGAGAGDDLDDP